MATNQTNLEAPIDTALEQAKDLSEQVLAASRKAGNLYLDSCEKAVSRAVDVELRVAGLTQQDWLKSLLQAQADFTRELADSYTSTARSLLK